jgi:hypothetical protein
MVDVAVAPMAAAEVCTAASSCLDAAPGKHKTGTVDHYWPIEKVTSCLALSSMQH